MKGKELYFTQLSCKRSLFVFSQAFLQYLASATHLLTSNRNTYIHLPNQCATYTYSLPTNSSSPLANSSKFFARLMTWPSHASNGTTCSLSASAKTCTYFKLKANYHFSSNKSTESYNYWQRHPSGTSCLPGAHILRLQQQLPPLDSDWIRKNGLQAIYCMIPSGTTTITESERYAILPVYLYNSMIFN